jgi:hypothetical protein
MNSKLMYCCGAMEEEINDPRVFIEYAPKYREYSIGTIDQKIVRIIFMCPWCGKKLPKSLREEWFDILEKDFRLDDPWDKEQEIFIPNEFKSDEWWIKRNL